MVRTAPKLKRLYKRLNRKYFKNRLPNIKIGWSKNLKWQGSLGLTTWWHGTPPKYQIEVANEMRGSSILTEWVVLHEMTHVLLYSRKLDVGHGPEFQKQMLRLAKAGAFSKIW